MDFCGGSSLTRVEEDSLGKVVVVVVVVVVAAAAETQAIVQTPMQHPQSGMGRRWRRRTLYVELTGNGWVRVQRNWKGRVTGQFLGELLAKSRMHSPPEADPL